MAKADAVPENTETGQISGTQKQEAEAGGRSRRQKQEAEAGDRSSARY